MSGASWIDARLWTQWEIDVLLQLWARGVSTTEIGRRLGRSNRSVIGKADRLNLPEHPGSNSIGYGVQQRASGRFSARIRDKGAAICLGTFDTAEEARAAYLDAARRYGRIAA